MGGRIEGAFQPSAPGWVLVLWGGRVPKEVDVRVKWLMKKLAESHTKIEQYEQEMVKSKKQIASLRLNNGGSSSS